MRDEGDTIEVQLSRIHVCMSNIRPFRALAVDRNGHLREGGPLVWLSKFNPLSFIATAYVEILRSTPVLVQIFIIYYGVFGMRCV